MNPSETLIRQYYACFNERRLSDAAALFADDAVLAQGPHRQFQQGGAGYLQLANTWLTAFPDAVLTVERVVSGDEGTHEANLVLRGTHRGALDLGSLVFRPTGTFATLNVRELLQLRDGRITFSSLSFDLQQMVEQLVIVDRPKVLEHLERVRKDGDLLAAAQDDPARSREIIIRLGLELDAARHAVRPYFKR